MKEIGVIFLAGGIGTRMKSSLPKQYMLLKGKPIALYSFEVFESMPEIKEIVVVCSPDYRSLFNSHRKDLTVRFALPGTKRQDSVYNGLLSLSSKCTHVCIHDGVRPFISEKLIGDVIASAYQHQAAIAAIPVKYTIKECSSDAFVVNTPDRSTLWEIQTPQVIEKKLLEKGFAHVFENGLTVTDDASLVELLGVKVKIVKGSPANVKITIPEDLIFSEALLSI